MLTVNNFNVSMPWELRSRRESWLTTICFSTLILVSSLICRAQDPPELAIDIQPDSPWKKTHVTIDREGKPALTDVPARERVYKIATPRPGLDPIVAEYTITALIVPESGIHWLGLTDHRSLFIEQGGQLHCAHRDQFGDGLTWVPNRFNLPAEKGADVDRMIARLKEQEVVELVDRYGRNRLKNLSFRESHLTHTNIVRCLGRDFHQMDSSGVGPLQRKTQFKVVEVKDGEVQLSLHKTGLRHRITAWIDLEYRRVTKAMVDDRQTWPEKPLGSERLRLDYVRPRRTSPEHAAELWVMDLEFRYRDLRSKADDEQNTRRSDRFAELMRDWNSIGCSADNLKSVAGNPTREDEESLEYQFDDDTGKHIWKFKLSSKGIIRGVEWIPGD